MAATILGSSLAFIDGSVVNVALPAIQANLAASLGGAQWVVTAYLLMLGALILVGGAIGDRFGRRRVFAYGIVVFTIASIFCGVAPDVRSLIAARVVQGAGAAFLVPGSLAIISAVFPPRERDKAIGTWAGFSALTSAFGPVLGGWLVDTLSWRAIFFINIPIALVTLGLSFRFVPESRGEEADVAVDWGGGLLATLGLAGLAYGLTQASDLGWTRPAVVGSLLASAVVLGIFVWHEARAAAPMVPLSLFRSAAFSGTNMITLLLYFALSGALFLLPFNLIRFHGYSAALAGLAFLPLSATMGALSRWAGGLDARYGARRPLIVGQVIAAAGFALLALPGAGGSYWTTFLPALLVLGLGMAVSVAPLTATVMGAVENRYAGVASGINNAVARVAGMLAVALLGGLAVGVFGTILDRRLNELQVQPELRRALNAEASKLGEATVPPGVTGERRQELDRALTESFVQSFRVVMLVTACLALAGVLCASLTIDASQTGP